MAEGITLELLLTAAFAAIAAAWWCLLVAVFFFGGRDLKWRILAAWTVIEESRRPDGVPRLSLEPGRRRPIGLAAAVEAALLEVGVSCRATDQQDGPTVRVVSVELEPGQTSRPIFSASAEVALILGVPAVRVVPSGPRLLALEVPRSDREPVPWSTLEKPPQGILPIRLGVDVAGRPVRLDLAQMPHLLIGGRTGSGKSSALHALILSMIARPTRPALLLIDPKQSEFSAYAGSSVLLAPVATSPESAEDLLWGAVGEMRARQTKMAAAGIRDLSGSDLPRLVIVIDELADLILAGRRDLSDPLIRIAQQGRAAGIHLVAATQRPSREVVTGQIKSNFPARLAFATTARRESEIILDQIGAESLHGNGDALYRDPNTGTLTRLQCGLVEPADIAGVLSAAAPRSLSS